MTLSSMEGTKWQRELEPIPWGWELRGPLHREGVCGEEGQLVASHGGSRRGGTTGEALG